MLRILLQPPVAELLPALCHALAARPQVILQAPPGAGKSTWLPLQLLQLPAFAGQQILLLEPRRLAARAVAQYLAQQLGEPLGQTIGLRMKLESKTSAASRLIVVTEGVLIRLLQADAELSDVGLVIFDEFHERSLQADFSLALCLDVQQGLRPDLKLLLMSATLDGAQLEQALPQAQLLTSAGRQFPVAVRYCPPNPQQWWLPQLAAVVLRALAEEPGNLLLFLPGAREIQQLQRLLAERITDPSVAVRPLYGAMPFAAQQQAIAPPAAGQRKVVLTTNLAETSLTIDGIRVVVDSGLRRQARLNPRTGSGRLRTVDIAQAAATQRAGRAGRLEAGVCYRLWSEAQHERRPAQEEPEIKLAALTDLVLDAYAWGAGQPQALPWVDLPPLRHWQLAEESLQALGLLLNQRLTPLGQRVVQLGMNVELAVMVCRAPAEAVSSALLLAALLADGSYEGSCAQTALARARDNSQLLRQARAWAARLDLRFEPTMVRPEQAASLIASAYPRYLAQRRGGGYRTYAGFGLELAADSPLTGCELLAVADFNDSDTLPTPRIQLAASLTFSELELLFASEIRTVEHLQWDEQAGRVVAERQRRLGALLLERQPLSIARDDPRIAEALAAALARRPIAQWPWSEAAQQWRARLILAATLDTNSNWPDVSDAALLASVNEWLVPQLTGVRSLAAISAELLLNGLLSLLDFAQQRRLDALLPRQLVTPTGNSVALDYTAEGGPRLAVRMQEMYGQARSPLLADGRVAVTLELLSPAGRPLQITRDLAAFWAGAYADVQKEMKGRYPKHYWPDDPAVAEPTRLTKSRMKSL